jgi:hypothetical protein
VANNSGSRYSNLLTERYGYLGASAAEIAFTALTRPDLLAGQLAHWSALEAATLVLLGAGLLPLIAPRLWPPLAALIVIPLLAQHDNQRTLTLHYMLVPATFAMVIAAVVLRSQVLRPAALNLAGGRIPVHAAAAAAVLLSAVAVFAWKSPLPPSFAAEAGQFEIDSHSRLAGSFVDMVPNGVPVSAQATYVPHLSQREDIYEFPRVGDAEWVVLDEKRPVPGYDLPGFDACLAELPALGFEIARQEDGITLWHKLRDGVPAQACG